MTTLVRKRIEIVENGEAVAILHSVERATDLGNRDAREGCDRCYCGCKYWIADTCIDCYTDIADCLADPEWVAENRT